MKRIYPKSNDLSKPLADRLNSAFSDVFAYGRHSLSDGLGLLDIVNAPRGCVLSITAMQFVHRDGSANDTLLLTFDDDIHHELAEYCYFVDGFIADALEDAFYYINIGDIEYMDDGLYVILSSATNPDGMKHYIDMKFFANPPKDES